jgi:hypothetical protein
MVQDRHNLVPVTLAVLLHVILFGSLFVVIDMGRRDHPAVPLAIKGALVTDNAVVIPPKIEEPPPRPDTSEQERLAAEEQKRIDDARIEQERLAAEEQKRLDDARIEKERIERIRQQEAEQTNKGAGRRLRQSRSANASRPSAGGKRKSSASVRKTSGSGARRNPPRGKPRLTRNPKGSLRSMPESWPPIDSLCSKRWNETGLSRLVRRLIWSAKSACSSWPVGKS